MNSSSTNGLGFSNSGLGFSNHGFNGRRNRGGNSFMSRGNTPTSTGSASIDANNRSTVSNNSNDNRVATTNNNNNNNNRKNVFSRRFRNNNKSSNNNNSNNNNSKDNSKSKSKTDNTKQAQQGLIVLEQDSISNNSSDASSALPDFALSVSPSSTLQFTLPHHHSPHTSHILTQTRCFCTLRLRHTGHTKSYTAYKVKTTQPKRYRVQPNHCGILSPGMTTTVTIRLLEKYKRTLVQLRHNAGGGSLMGDGA